MRPSSSSSRPSSRADAPLGTTKGSLDARAGPGMSTARSAQTNAAPIAANTMKPSPPTPTSSFFIAQSVPYSSVAGKPGRRPSRAERAACSLRLTPRPGLTFLRPPKDVLLLQRLPQLGDDLEQVPH